MAIEQPRPTPSVRLDRGFLLRFLIFLLPLLWPFAAFDRPSYIPDSVSYLKGGQAIVRTAMAKVHPAQDRQPRPTTTASPASPASAPPSSAAPSAEKASDVIGIRSLPYSIAAYVLRWPGMTMSGLAILQIIVSALICAAVSGALNVRSPLHLAGLSLVLAFMTPLAVVSATTVPDIFAGLLVAAYILYFNYEERLSTGIKLLLGAICIFAVASHASIPPLAAGMVLFCALLAVLGRRRGLALPWRALIWMVLPFVIGMGIVSAGNRVAFGDSNVYAKRFPLALARSVADGPARWYLESHCRTARYAVCEVFGTHYPDTVNGFMFDKTGLRWRASGEQMDRIRSEESEIVTNAALAYPGTELRKFAVHLARQLYRFRTNSSPFDTRVVIAGDGRPELAPTFVDHRPVLSLLDTASALLVIACLILAAWRYRDFGAREVLALGLLLIALLGSAVIVVAFSGVADRYEARLIWMIPLFLLAAILARRERARSPGADADQAFPALIDM